MKWDDFIGQDDAVVTLKALQHQNVNVLLRGPYGHGKTVLMMTYASGRQMLPGARWYHYDVPPREKIPDAKSGSVYTVDEIHLERVFERWYPIMDAKDVSVIFATTDYAGLPDPFVSRCVSITLKGYNISNLTSLLMRWYERAYPKRTNIHPSLCRAVAQRSANNPRVAIKILETAIAMKGPDIRLVELLGVFDRLGIDDSGYDEYHRKYLEILDDGNAYSLSYISKILRLAPRDVERIVEPLLLQDKKIVITTKGRKRL